MQRRVIEILKAATTARHGCRLEKIVNRIVGRRAILRTGEHFDQRKWAQAVESYQPLINEPIC